MSEQFESGHPPDSRGPYKVLLKQHDGWDRRNEEQRNEGAVTRLSTDASSLEREDHPRTLGAESDWMSDHRKEGVRDQRKMVGEEASSRKFDNQGAASVPKKVMSPESLEQIKTVDVISMKKSGTEASGTPEVAQPLLDSSLIQKIEGLNAKARVSDGRSDTSSVSTREEQKNRFQVNAKTNNSVNEPVGGGIVNPERSHATESINPSLEVGSTISIPRRSNRAMHDDRSDHCGRGRFNNQEGEGWSKKSLVSEPTTVVSTARFEIPSNVHLHDHLVSTEAIEKSGSYPQGRCEEELATPMVDPNDSEAQRARMRELAKQRTKQLQEEEEERTRRQMAKARAKLEELNRRTQVESSNQKIESHSSVAIQIKQEESQTAGEPLIGGRKSAVGSNLDGASRINESSTGKDEKSTVLASDLPSDTLKSVGKEPVLMHDESMPKPKEVIVANVVDRNNAPQAHESNITRSDKNSVQNHQPQKPDVVSEIEQPKSYDWNDSDGWNMPEEPVAVAPVSVSAKDQGTTKRGRQHSFKGQRAMGNNHDLDEKKNSRGDTYKNNNQFSASETGHTDLAAASRENRAVGERAAPHWQPKSQAHSGNSQLGNRANGGQNVVVEVGRTFKKETSPRGAVPRPATPNKDNTEYVAQHQHDQVISERNNAGEGHSKRERKASFRGHPHSPNQGHVTPVETAPVSMDTRQEQHFNTGFRKNGNQNSRFGRGQDSRGDWNYSGHDSRQHNHPANRERQRHSSHFEYQPVGPYNNNNKFNNSEEPRDGPYNTGGRVKERGQTHPRRGGGNFHGRQSGTSQVDADMEQ
ncbi:hypothetical protein DVH24_008707 [Malus domestica]|uniref:BAT2 N-terminal domain-containing protein n=1 Tax=Malus domestica TaxID=3750 RepID=A0A498JQP9_MALDO|nr:hypothetical protein DVH24_008707 [Malus domestica]